MSIAKSLIESRGWEKAIADAKKHIRRLNGVIAVCEEKKAKGENWPGDEQFKRQQREQQHSV